MTTVLIVDDERELPAALARDLRAHEYEVHVASSAEEAMRVLASTPVDVVISDLRMPDRDGIDLLGAIRSQLGGVQTILMSAFASARDAQTARDLGAVRVLCKPFSRVELLDAVREAVESKTGFRGSIHGLSLIDLLQMLHYARRSVTVSVDGTARGRIHLREGEIIAAESGELSGEPALRVLLASPSGSLRTSVLGPCEASIARDFQGLLLDALRTLDEQASDELDDFALEAPKSVRSGPPTSSRKPPDPSMPPPSRGAVDACSRLAATVASVAPEISAAVVDMAANNVLPVQNGEELDACAAEVAALAACLSRLTGDWLTFEYVGSNVGISLLWWPSGDAVVLMASVLAGRYATYRFRSEAGRVMGRIAS